MGWATELQNAFQRLETGQPVRVEFAGRPGLEGELGRELNNFAEQWRKLPPGDLSRELRHSLRNRIAGILAAVHVLRETSQLPEQDQEALRQSLEVAQKLDARLDGKAKPARQ